jgi:NADPH:quinone reductase-like Zn-dependent oxidoreductase
MNERMGSINKLSPEQIDRLFRKLKGGKKDSGLTGSMAKTSVRRKLFQSAEHGNFRMEIAKPGIWESLKFQVSHRIVPQPGEVEIEVYAAGLNFRDVLIALGMYPTSPDGAPTMGGEVSGKITAVGEGVHDFHVGDDVMALATPGFQAFVTTPAEGVVHKSPAMTFETAAGIPVGYITCIYGLQHLARLSKGERILIHSAAGGVGLAAIQIAQWIGAEVFATVGTAEKREFIRSIGIRHIMDSRSTDFADAVMKLTNDEGVDVILNSLAGDAIPKGLHILRPYGRFIELGKRDVMENRQVGLFPFRKGISFSVVELSWLPTLRPGLLKKMFEQIMELFGQGLFKPLPTRFFPIAESAKAFSFMARGTHIGKIVLLVKGQEVLVEEQSS